MTQKQCRLKKKKKKKADLEVFSDPLLGSFPKKKKIKHFSKTQEQIKYFSRGEKVK